MLDFPKRVLVATDGSEDAALALQAAADISAATGSELHLVHVWPGPPLSPVRLSSQVGVTTEDLMREPEHEARELLRQQAWAAGAAGATVAGMRLRQGRPAKEIARLAEEIEADLVVVGSRRMGALIRLLPGSVSRRVARAASCPVLVVRGEWPPSRVVVGDDFSREAGRAGELGAGIGGLYGAPVLLTTAYLPSNGYLSYAANRRRARKTERMIGRELQARAAVLGSALGVVPHTEVAPRHPVDVLRPAGKATLVAVGSRDVGAVYRALLGSVSAWVQRTASGPILIAPPVEEHSLEDLGARDLPRHRGRGPAAASLASGATEETGGYSR